MDNNNPTKKLEFPLYTKLAVHLISFGWNETVNLSLKSSWYRKRNSKDPNTIIMIFSKYLPILLYIIRTVHWFLQDLEISLPYTVL